MRSPFLFGLEVPCGSFFVVQAFLEDALFVPRTNKAHPRGLLSRDKRSKRAWVIRFSDDDFSGRAVLAVSGRRDVCIHPAG